MANKQPYQFPVGTLTLQKVVPIQTTTGGPVEKITIQQLVTFIQTLGITGGTLIFENMDLLKQTTILVHKTIIYYTLGNDFDEFGAKYYYDIQSNLADNGKSILIPYSINPFGLGRFIQTTA